MNRTEHLDWAKHRANEYLDQGQPILAWQSMRSDLIDHDELRNHPGIQIGTGMLILGQLQTEAAMRKFISEFS